MIKLWSVHTQEDIKIALKGQHFFNIYFFSFTLSVSIKILCCNINGL